MSSETCPVVHDFRFTGAGEAMEAFERYDRLRDHHRIVRVEEPAGAYYLPLDRDLIVAGMQDYRTFSSRALTPLQPNPSFAAIPVMLDPPEHTKWRRVLAGYFTLSRTAGRAERVRACCDELIDQFVGAEGCDFVDEFAYRFPTTIFLELFGLPPSELDTFLGWERAILHPDENGELDRTRQLEGAIALFERLRLVVEDRRRRPDKGALDILSAATGWRIDGEPVGDDEIVSCCLLLFMAGLDTVANALSFSFWHLATHVEDRRHLAGDPAGRAPAAAEELLRAFPIGQVARKVTKEVSLGGVDLHPGDMVLFPLAEANRDPHHLPGGRTVDLARAPVVSYTFGTGPHRCLGSHLARLEMTVALERWHTRLPDYELATTEPVRGHWGSVHGLRSLPLRFPRA